MSDARRVALDLHFEADGVAGHVDTEEGERRPFSSWLGLLSLLQALRADPESR